MSDKEVAQVKQSWYLFILKFIIKSELIILANACRRITYLEISTDIKQLWHKRLGHTSHICIKYFTKIVDGI